MAASKFLSATIISASLAAMAQAETDPLMDRVLEHRPDRAALL